MGEIECFSPKTVRRMVRLATRDDLIVNNTEREVAIREQSGALIELVRPGRSFSSETPREVYFDSVRELTFRSYINDVPPEGWPRKIEVVEPKSLMHAL